MQQRALSDGPPGPADAAGARVAILMRTRDRPVLLARALASVLAQRHAHWHLLLVNDGGDPGPVQALVSRHETGFGGRITVSHRTDSAGPDAALAAALLLSDTAGAFDHVAVHDDDDSWHPDFLQQTTAWLADPARHLFVAVITRWTVVHEQVDRAGILERAREPAPFEDAVVRLDALLGRPRFPSICLLQRHPAALRAGGFHPGAGAGAGAGSGSVGGADGAWEHALRLIAEGEIGVLPDPLACLHRRDPGALPDDANLADAASSGLDPRQLLSRNAALRTLGRTQPAALSVLGALGAQAERHHERAEQRRDLVLANLDRNGLWGHARHEDLQHRLVRVEAALARIETALAELRAPRPAARLRSACRRFAAGLARRSARWLPRRSGRGSVPGSGSGPGPAPD